MELTILFHLFVRASHRTIHRFQRARRLACSASRALGANKKKIRFFNRVTRVIHRVTPRPPRAVVDDPAMHIEEVCIDGFKSYAKRTVVPGFDPLFNAITGLNGSGKSNILDSICFVLGISNLTHVRPNDRRSFRSRRFSFRFRSRRVGPSARRTREREKDETRERGERVAPRRSGGEGRAREAMSIMNDAVGVDD